MRLNYWYRVWQNGSSICYYVKPYKRYSSMAYWADIYDIEISQMSKTIISEMYWDNVTELSSLEQELM
jgi:hypothetical protein